MFDGERRRQKALFAMVDEAALFGAVSLALFVHDPSHAMLGQILNNNQPLAVAVCVVMGLTWMLVLRAFDLYRLRNGGLDEAVAVVKACAAGWLLLILFGFFAHFEVSRLTLALGYLFCIPLVIAGRALVRRCIRRLYADPKIAIPLVIVGFNELSRYLCDHILSELSQYDFLGFISEGQGEYRGRRVLGGGDAMRELATAYGCLEAMIALPDESPDLNEQMIQLCESLRVRWRVVPKLFGAMATAMKVDIIGMVPLIGPRSSNIEGLNFLVKRGFDLAVASIVTAMAAPVMLVAALATWLSDGRPILLRQTRVGIYGRPFEMLKFRTMRSHTNDSVHRAYVKSWITENGAADEQKHGKVFKLTHDPRITPVGKWLRRFSIDELPQLINVLRGEMSLIGPRPALPYELDLYQDWHRRRLDAHPGITGLWQVSGRNRLSFDDMVRLDIEYIEDWSIATDLRILMRTLPAMLHGGF